MNIVREKFKRKLQIHVLIHYGQENDDNFAECGDDFFLEEYDDKNNKRQVP